MSFVYLFNKLRTSKYNQCVQKHGPEVEYHHRQTRYTIILNTPVTMVITQQCVWKTELIAPEGFYTYTQLQEHYSLVVNFLGGGLAPGAVETVQLAEGAFCPDAETTHMSTGSQLQQVQLVHILQCDAFERNYKGLKHTSLHKVNMHTYH